MILKSITEAIGNTPLLLIPPEVHGIPYLELYAKLEHLNPFGSVKDRAALGMLGAHLHSLAADGRGVVEASSGNTAKAMQALCSLHGIPFRCVTNRLKVRETAQTLRLLGATVEELPGKSDCHDPRDPNDPTNVIAREVAASAGSLFHPSQYVNEDNPKVHYETTGAEIARDLPAVDYFFGGLGTTGSTRGTATRIRESNEALKMVGVLSARGDFIPGIRSRDELLEVGLFNAALYEELCTVTAADAIDEMLLLIRRCGVLCGPTSGACLAGVRKFFTEHPLQAPAQAVFIVCDRVESYLSYIQERRPDALGESASVEAPITDEELAAVEELTPEEIQERQDIILLDIRGPLAFKTGRISGSLNIPEAYLEQMAVKGIPLALGQNVVILCPFGERSKKLAALLNRAGGRAFSAAGGIMRWREAGHEFSSGREIHAQ